MESINRKLIRKIYKSQFNLRCKFSGPFGDRYITYADYIASGQPLKFIEKYIQKVVLPSYANTHTESSYTGLQTSHFREEARELIKNSVNATKNDALLFTGSGSTGAIDLLIRKLTQFYSSEKILPVIFIGPYEHHSNILPWRESPFDLVEIGMCKAGNVNLEHLEEQLQKYHNKRPLIGSFSAASNVTGIIAPLNSIHSLLKKYDALSFWDYAGAAPYLEINMNPKDSPGLDALFISPHKLVGGPGSPGILVVKKHLFKEKKPVVVGGGTVHFVTKSKQMYLDDIEVREEGGTPSIIASIRAGLAFKLKDEVGAKTIEKLEHIYITQALELVKNHPNIYVLGNLESPRLGFLAFQVRFSNRFLHHNFVVALLNDLFGIQARGGCSCAGPYGHDLLQMEESASEKYIQELNTGNEGIKPGWVRLNFNYFIPRKEYKYILDCIIWVADNGWKLLNSYQFDEQKGLWTYKYKSKESSTYKLKNFIVEEKITPCGSFKERKKVRQTYLAEADALCNLALSKAKDEPNQEYKFEQIDNPLRWYSLANDLEV